MLLDKMRTLKITLRFIIAAYLNAAEMGDLLHFT